MLYMVVAILAQESTAQVVVMPDPSADWQAALGQIGHPSVDAAAWQSALDEIGQLQLATAWGRPGAWFSGTILTLEATHSATTELLFGHFARPPIHSIRHM